MPSKKLLIVLGAGASIEFGMPSVSDIGNIISAKMKTLYPLATARHPSNLYIHIERLVRRYWNRVVPSPVRRDPNFEDVLYAIFAVAAAYPAGAFTSALGALIQPKNLPDVRLSGTVTKVGRQVLHHLGNDSVDELLSEFRNRCNNVKLTKSTELARLQTFVDTLRMEFDVAILSLNYDNIFYRTVVGIETGFDPTTNEFNERRIFNRKDWPCMLHLHGSVHFDMPIPIATTRDLHEVHWQPNLLARFAQNATGRSTRPMPEGADFPTSAVVAGYGKTTQILRRPFRTYYSELDRLVSGSDALLIAGYGFGDPHLNIALERYRDARKRPVAIIDFAKRGTMTLAGYGDSPLSRAVVHTLHTDLHSMRWLGYSAPGLIDDLLLAKDFEVSNNPDTPLSVWYNGMLEACSDPSKIIAKLQ